MMHSIETVNFYIINV